MLLWSQTHLCRAAWSWAGEAPQVPEGSPREPISRTCLRLQVHCTVEEDQAFVEVHVYMGLGSGSTEVRDIFRFEAGGPIDASL